MTVPRGMTLLSLCDCDKKLFKIIARAQCLSMHQEFALPLYHILWYPVQTRTLLSSTQYCWLLNCKAEYLCNTSIHGASLHNSHPNTLYINSTSPSAITVCSQLKLHSTTTVYSQYKPHPIVLTKSTPFNPQTPKDPWKQWELCHSYSLLFFFFLSQSFLPPLSFCLRTFLQITQMTNLANVSYT